MLRMELPLRRLAPDTTDVPKIVLPSALRICMVTVPDTVLLVTVKISIRPIDMGNDSNVPPTTDVFCGLLTGASFASSKSEFMHDVRMRTKPKIILCAKRAVFVFIELKFWFITSKTR